MVGREVCERKSRDMAQRTTRASRGEHTSGIALQPETIQASIFSAQKNIKVDLALSLSLSLSVSLSSLLFLTLLFDSFFWFFQVRKWRKVLVKIGELKIPKWLPDSEVQYSSFDFPSLCLHPARSHSSQEPNEDLQKTQSNKRALHKKAGKSRSKRKSTTRDVRQEVIGDYEDENWDMMYNIRSDLFRKSMSNSEIYLF